MWQKPKMAVRLGSGVTHDPNWIPYGINFLSDTHGWVGGSTGGYWTVDGDQTCSKLIWDCQ